MMENNDNDRWWERFWKYKTTDNNQHDWFMVWADHKLSGKEKCILNNIDKKDEKN